MLNPEEVMRRLAADSARKAQDQKSEESEESGSDPELRKIMEEDRRLHSSMGEELGGGGMVWHSQAPPPSPATLSDEESVAQEAFAYRHFDGSVNQERHADDQLYFSIKRRVICFPLWAVNKRRLDFMLSQKSKREKGVWKHRTKEIAKSSQTAR